MLKKRERREPLDQREQYVENLRLTDYKQVLPIKNIWCASRDLNCSRGSRCSSCSRYQLNGMSPIGGDIRLSFASFSSAEGVIIISGGD